MKYLISDNWKKMHKKLKKTIGDKKNSRQLPNALKQMLRC